MPSARNPSLISRLSDDDLVIIFLYFLACTFSIFTYVTSGCLWWVWIVFEWTDADITSFSSASSSAPLSSFTLPSCTLNNPKSELDADLPFTASVDDETFEEKIRNQRKI